jgi:hypothetical protein
VKGKGQQKKTFVWELVDPARGSITPFKVFVAPPGAAFDLTHFSLHREERRDKPILANMN